MKKIERCFQCNEPTGSAGPAEDSIYINDIGPFCETCYHELVDNIVLHNNVHYSDSALAAKQQEVNNAMELLFKEQRRYDALHEDVRALVDAFNKYRGKSSKCGCKLCNAIAAVEARMKEVK